VSVASVNEYWENEAKKGRTRERAGVRYAYVIELTHGGEPIIQFTGDKLPSQKTYVRLKSYEPAAGDRVMLLNDVIIGGWPV
jgi:hypothetical protein